MADILNAMQRGSACIAARSGPVQPCARWLTQRDSALAFRAPSLPCLGLSCAVGLSCLGLSRAVPSEQPFRALSGDVRCASFAAIREGSFSRTQSTVPRRHCPA